MVEIERGDDEDECQTEEEVEVQAEDEHGETRGDEHGARDQEEPRDVITVLHDGRHDQPAERLKKERINDRQKRWLCFMMADMISPLNAWKKNEYMIDRRGDYASWWPTWSVRWTPEKRTNKW